MTIHATQHLALADELINESIREQSAAEFDDTGHESHVARLLAEVLDERGTRKHLPDGRISWTGKDADGDAWTVIIRSYVI